MTRSHEIRERLEAPHRPAVDRDAAAVLELEGEAVPLGMVGLDRAGPVGPEVVAVGLGEEFGGYVALGGEEVSRLAAPHRALSADHCVALRPLAAEAIPLGEFRGEAVAGDGDGGVGEGFHWAGGEAGAVAVLAGSGG